MERQAARFRERQRPQVVDKPRQHPRLVEDRGEVRLIRWVDAVEQRLEVALDDAQRRSELVADVGEERAPLALIRVEPLRHRVEVADQRVEGRRAASRGVDADREVAVRDPPGCVGQLIERARRAR